MNKRFLTTLYGVAGQCEVNSRVLNHWSRERERVSAIFLSCTQVFQEPKNDGECLGNIREFLKGCASYRVEVSSLLLTCLCLLFISDRVLFLFISVDAILFELVAFEADRVRQSSAQWDAGNHIGLILYKPNQTAVCTL